MENQNKILKIIVEGTSFQIKKELLLRQLDESQRNTIQDKLVLPAWTTVDIYKLLQKYLKNKNMDAYKQKSQDTVSLIQTLRLTDCLGMVKFQQKFINQVITNCLNISNCVIFLQQTHRKLKNQQNGSQCWYSLLNASITYLALHLKEVYQVASDKLKRLHEKILNQILDRSIRNGNYDDQMIFELIMESRKAISVDSLCLSLRNAIQTKKINPKIHAKLSWKLQEVASIKDKKTKVFKFLDFQWMLQANRSKNNDLIVKLNFCGIEGKCEIGTFYVKVMWWLQGKSDQKKQQQIKINYLLMNKKQDLQIMAIPPALQNQLGKNKVELSIFCCMDQIYTFTLNYIAKHHEKLTIDERKLTAQELYIIISILKQRKQYSSSIRFLKYLAHLKSDVPAQLTNGYPLSQLTPYQIDFIQKINPQRILPPELTSQLSSQTIQNRSIATSQSKRSQDRPQSRGRLRKIFASSPSKSLGVPQNSLKLEDITKIANLKNYFYENSHPYYNQI